MKDESKSNKAFVMSIKTIMTVSELLKLIRYSHLYFDINYTLFPISKASVIALVFFISPFSYTPVP